jgi:oxygen-independent coproporphyrinogen-3 oxidase
VDRLEQEIRTYATRLGRPFDTIFIGGGNPGCLLPGQLETLLEAATPFGPPAECTIETNPETFTPAFFPLLERRLVTRLSMGIQSMDDRMLEKLGRNARRKDNMQAILLATEARRLFGTDLSFDLMTCIPGQTEEDALADIDELVSLADPGHLSLYCLTVEEGTRLAKTIAEGTLAVLDEDGQQRMLASCWNHLSSLGFRHYEVSNFARDDGSRCLHNLHYWNLDSYIGLGSSAASTLLLEGSAVSVIQNQDLATFARTQPFCGYETETLDATGHLEEFLLMALRTDEGIGKTAFSRRFGRRFDALFSKPISTLDRSWFIDGNERFSLTEAGMFVLDDIVLRLAMAIP